MRRACAAALHRYRTLASGVFPACDDVGERVKRQQIAFRAEPCDHAASGRADEAVMAEALALEDVGKVHLHGGKLASEKRIVERDGGMGISPGHHDDP